MTTDNNSDAIAALKGQVFTLLVALIVISGTLTAYLYRQQSLAGKDLVQAEQLGRTLTQNEAAINTFINKLVVYGERHPDFVPVLKKYGIAPVPGIPAGSPVGMMPKK